MTGFEKDNQIIQKRIASALELQNKIKKVDMMVNYSRDSGITLIEAKNKIDQLLMST